MMAGWLRVAGRVGDPYRLHDRTGAGRSVLFLLVAAVGTASAGLAVRIVAPAAARAPLA